MVLNPGAGETLTEYELARAARIHANQARLKELGLVEAAKHVDAAVKRAQPKRRAAPKQEEAEARDPFRRSKRQQGIASAPLARRWAPHAGQHTHGFFCMHAFTACVPEALLCLSMRTPDSPSPSRPLRPCAAPSYGDVEDYHDHNAYRVSYMSDQALSNRIQKIRNKKKIASLIEVRRTAIKHQQDKKGHVCSHVI